MAKKIPASKQYLRLNPMTSEQILVNSMADIEWSTTLTTWNQNAVSIPKIIRLSLMGSHGIIGNRIKTSSEMKKGSRGEGKEVVSYKVILRIVVKTDMQERNFLTLASLLQLNQYQMRFFNNRTNGEGRK
jgi:hypothetical protein